MTAYDPVPLPAVGTAAEPAAVADGVAAWIASPPLRDLVDAYGGAAPGASTGADLDYLDAFSAEHWDFRGGRERHEAEVRPLPPHRERFVADAAAALGLAERAAPARERYTHVLILGGMAGSCLSRAAFAARLLSHGTASAQITGVGGFRPFGAADERAAAAAGYRGGRFEVDAIEEGLRRAFALDGEPAVTAGGDPDDDPGAAWSVATWRGRERTVRAVAAPSSRPGRRADTVDTCRYWADEVARLCPGDSVLVVTSAPFVPFQHCDAVNHLGLSYNCSIDTVGVGAIDTSGGPAPYTAGGYLQEIRSAIRSMRRLHAAALTATTSERE